MTREQRLSELATLVGVWRSAACLNDDIENPHMHACDGENHVEGCPSAKALDDVIAAHNALGAPGMR